MNDHSSDPVPQSGTIPPSGKRARINVVLFQPSLRSNRRPASAQGSPAENSGDASNPIDPTSFTEVIVGTLVGRPGIDLMLLGRPDQLVDGATETLAMQSVGGEIVVLTWESADSILKTLDDVNITGYRARHRDDPEAIVETDIRQSQPLANRTADLSSNPAAPERPAAPKRSTRPIYYVDLWRYRSIDELVDLLEHLRSSTTIKVTGLTLSTGPQITGPQRTGPQITSPPRTGSATTTPSSADSPPGELQAPLAKTLPSDTLPVQNSGTQKSGTQKSEFSTPPSAGRSPEDPHGELNRWMDELDEFDA